MMATAAPLSGGPMRGGGRACRRPLEAPRHGRGGGGARPPPGGGRPPPEATPGWNRQRAERSHGEGYAEWEGWQQMRILASCDAAPGDQVILTAAQLDRICRSQGIKN